jgi:hypothetical protein
MTIPIIFDSLRITGMARIGVFHLVLKRELDGGYQFGERLTAKVVAATWVRLIR